MGMVKDLIQPLRLGLAAARRLYSAPAKTAVGKTSSLAGTLAAKGGGGEVAKESKPLYRRLSALGNAADGSVVRTMNKWIRERREVRVDDLIKYVKGLRKFRRHRHALELMDWMVKNRGMNLSHTNHAIRLDLISKVRGIDAAEEYFSSLPEPAKKQQTYGALFNCFCKEKMPEKAIAIYEKMKELNLTSNTLVQNNLMALYMKLGQPEKVVAQLEEMKSKNIAPDNVTYCILMNSYAALNDIDSVEGIIREMEEGGEVVIHWTAYSTLAAIYNSTGFFTKTESALKRLEALMDGHDPEPFDFLISLYATAGNLAEVKRVWKSLKSVIPKPTNMRYFIILQALSKLDDFDGLKQCFQEWESACITYDMRLANLMIGAYLKNSMLKEAELVQAKAKEKGAEFDFRTSEMFIDYYFKRNLIGRAMRYLELPTSPVVATGKWQFSPEKVNAFLKHFEKQKDVDGAEKFCKILKTNGSLDSEAYKLLLRTYSAASRAEPSLRQRIKDDNIVMNPELRKLLRKVCVN